MIDDKIRDRISGLDELGENCNYEFHDAELKSINYEFEDDKTRIVLTVKHWKQVGEDYYDVLITFTMNNVLSYYMENNLDRYALEIYFEEYDGESQGFYDDCMKVSSDMGFSVVCKRVDIQVTDL